MVDTVANTIFERIDQLSRDADYSALKKLGRWFEGTHVTEKLSSAPMCPTLILTEEGKAHFTASADSHTITEIANALVHAQRLVKYRHRPPKSNALRILCDGDSWFQYPVVMKDVIDYLSQAFAIRSVGVGGHLLSDIENHSEYVQTIHDERADVFLLSCGGSDLLGKVEEQERMLLFLHECTSQEDPRNLFQQEALDSALSEISDALRRICTRALERDGDLQILLHGYDYALPQPDGVWLGTPMSKRGIPKKLQKDIVRVLIDHYYDMLFGVAKEIGPNLTIVDLRGKVSNNSRSWYDELHPRAPGFKRVASEFHERLLHIQRNRKKKGRLIPTISQDKTVSVRSRNDFASLRNLSPVTNECRDGICRLSGGPTHASPADAKRWFNKQPMNICNNLDLWRDKLTISDLEAYEGLLQVVAELDQPDSIERQAIRHDLSRSLPGLHLPDIHSSSERIIGNSDLHGIAYLERGMEVAQTVARIRARDNLWQSRGMGSGFLVGENLLLTNHHVLFDGTQKNSLVDLDYELDHNGNARPISVFGTDHRIYLTDEELDFTLIGLQPYSSEGRPLSEFGWMQLLLESGKALKREKISSIQHPGGRHKEIALHDSQVLGRDGDFLYYTTDTEAGSSGSPVLSQDWHVVALHHRTVPDPYRPCSWLANRGIRISRILSRVRSIAEDSSNADAAIAQEVWARLFSAPPPSVARASSRTEGSPDTALTIAPITVSRPNGDKVASRNTPIPALVSSEEKIHGHDDRKLLSASDPRHSSVLKTDCNGVWGSCVVVRGYLLLTVAHVIQGPLKLFHFDDHGNGTDICKQIGARDFQIKQTSSTGRAAEFTGLKLISKRPLAAQLVPTLVSPSDLVGQVVEVIGYPSVLHDQAAGDILAVHRGVVAATKDGLMHYTGLDTYEGQSGGAVVLAGTNRLVGLHLSGPISPHPPDVYDYNTGIHISSTQLKEISQWA